MVDLREHEGPAVAVVRLHDRQGFVDSDETALGIGAELGLLCSQGVELGNQSVRLKRFGGPGEEPSGRHQVAASRHKHVDDLAVAVDRPVHVAPASGDLHAGLVNEPSTGNRVTTRPAASTRSGVNR